MLKIDQSFHDLIDIAKDLLGPPRDRSDVYTEYQRGVLELVAYLTVGTEENARQFLADEMDLDLEALYAKSPDRDGSDGVTIPADTLLEWAGPLTAAQVSHLAAALPHSTVPDAVGEIAASVRSSSDNGWYRRTPFRDDDATTLRASERSERTEGRAASVSEHGDVGGDNQASAAHSLSWQRALADGTFETLTMYHYTVETTGEYHVETQIELIRHRDANDVGGTEIAADYKYESSDTFGWLSDQAYRVAHRRTSEHEALDPQILWWQI